MSSNRPAREDAITFDCAVCRKRFKNRDLLTDYVENSHSIITNTIERNSLLVFDEGDIEDGQSTRRSGQSDDRAPGDHP